MNPINVDNIALFFLPTRGATSVNPKERFGQLFPKFNNSKSSDFLINLVNFKQKQTQALAEFLNNSLPLADSGLNYQEYFQFSNARIQRLADGIVEDHWSDDKKAYEIEQWVIDNIEYVSDLKNHGKMEYWSRPTETLNRMTGDCEDGAFLIGSLMLHAGVDDSKIFFYGGMVRLEEGSLELGGHGWIGYKRNDGEVVPLDWCYYPTSESLNERKLLKDNMNYYDDMFVTTLRKTVETPYVNYVRNPEKMKGLAVYAKAETGRVVNQYA